MGDYKLFVHFHKRFPFNYESNWVVPTGYESDLELDGDYVCLSAKKPCIESILPYSERYTESMIGYLGQTISVEYWILHHVTNVKYVGVTGYRRYPLFSHDWMEKRPVIDAYATPENMRLITNDGHIETMGEILKVFDVIVPKPLYYPRSVEDQYLESQRQDIWNLFIECLVEVVPEYKSKLQWFKLSYNNFFYGPMGMNPIGIYKEYADIYLKIVKLICERAVNPFLVQDENARMRTDRWIGFLAERFYPFFLFANKITSYHVPTVYLESPPASIL